MIRLRLHAVSNPVENGLHQTEGKHFQNELPVLRVHPLTAGLGVEDALHQGADQAGEVGLDEGLPLPLDGAVAVEDHSPVVLEVGHHIAQALLPGVRRHISLQHPLPVLHDAPLHQRVDVLKVVVKGLAAHLRVIHQILDGDFIQRGPLQQLLQRRGQGPLGEIGHSFAHLSSRIF